MTIPKQIFFAITVLTLCGCAVNVKMDLAPQEIIRVKTPIAAELKSVHVSIAAESERLGEIEIKYAGGFQTEAIFQVRFKDALEEAIFKSAIFDDFAKQKVTLTAMILKYESPSAGIEFDTHFTVRYSLIDRQNGHVIFAHDIESDGKVDASYALSGATRATAAKNIAVKKNIAQFIEDLKQFATKQ